MENNPTPTDPPAPWLGTAAGDGAPLQSWSLGVRPGAFLVVRYGFDPAGHRRCWWKAYRNSVPFLFLLSISFAVLVGASHFFIMYLLKNGYLSDTIAKFLRVVLPNRVAPAIITILMYPLMILFLLYSVGDMDKKRQQNMPPTTFVADAEGIRNELAGRTGGAKTKWSKIKNVRFENGDTYFLARGMAVSLFVPRSAFADNGAAARFADVAIALWKANGDASVVDPDALAEFRG